MALIKRKKTIRGALRDVAIAPFVFILAMAWANRFWLALAIGLMLFCMWMAREPLAGLIPNTETLYMWLGVIAFIAIAAVPLAIRDYFSNRGYETVWQPTKGCFEATKQHVDLLISGNFQQFHSSFSESLQFHLPRIQFQSDFDALIREFGALQSISDMEEMEIPEHIFTDPDYDSATDCIVQVALNHAGHNKSLIALYLNSSKSFEITNIQIVNCET
ncbi:MAG: hypothetical protein R3C18_13420 [Planctomycetaceae bacterium]